MHSPIETDAVIIGAGPVGLFQVFELGLLEIKAHVIDSLPEVGGQCIELYPDKPIYDIPAIPVCTGRELIGNLLKQIEPFKPQFHLNQEVSSLDKQTDGDFWKRFSASRNKFDKRRRTHFAQLEATAGKVTEAKRAIIEEAEKLATSTDWVATARRFKSLMDAWKAAGRGKKGDDAKNWARFKAAQDQFFAAKSADLEKREVSMVANLAKREELIVQIEALIPFTDVKAAKNSLRELMRSWEKIGITHRDKRAAFEARIAKVEEEIKSAEAEIWRKTDPSAKARAAEVVTQLEESIENYKKAAAKATSAGNDKKAKEALESAQARTVWLEEAKKHLAEFN